MKHLLFFFCSFLLVAPVCAQKSSFLVLGDLHYDRLEDHDMKWLREKPDDLRQVTEEYTVYTKEHWDDFMNLLREKVSSYNPPVKAVVQLGDLSEGLAGSEAKARQMASNAMKAVENVKMPVPWIIAKGNHDITGPGAKAAFQEFYVPVFREQTRNPDIKNASYSYRFNDVLVTCIDPYDRETDMVSSLEKALGESDARYKFVAVHEPLIPVTERCWHLLRRDSLRREKLLSVIARHKAIVLCGHLHRYSVVRRDTPEGPIVQVMVVSVVRDRDYLEPDNLITRYGPALAGEKPGWQPETMEARIAVLAEEAKFVTHYKQTDLPGYAIISVDEKKERILMEYYAAFGKKPYDKIDLTGLQNN